MQKEDLQQIKELLQENNEVLRKEIREAIGDNNKVVFERMDEMEERIMTTTKNQFDEVFEKLDGVEGRLKSVEGGLSDVEDRLSKVENLNRNIYDRMVEATDTTMNDLRLDMDRVKFIHLDEWKELPPQREISEALAAEGMVS